MTSKQRAHLINRILNSITINKETGCWIWNKYCNKRTGYGHFWVGQSSDGSHIWKSAHKISHELFIGPVPDGKEVAHKCHTRACCNPKHLIATTHKENSHMSVDAGRFPKGVTKPNAKLNDEMVRIIKEGSIFNHLSMGSVAKIFNVSRSTIRSVIVGDSWAHIKVEGQATRFARTCPS